MPRTKAEDLFNNKLDSIFDGTEVNTAQVALPDGARADVVMTVVDSPAFDRFIVSGVARYNDGHIVGEQHVQLASSVTTLKGHRHKQVYCTDFEQRNGLFVPRGTGDVSDADPQNLPQRMEGNAGLMLGHIVMYQLVTTGNRRDVFDSTNDGPLLVTARLRGLGETHELFADLALQAALDEHIVDRGLLHAGHP